MVQQAVTGYQINIMDIGQVYKVAESASDMGQDIPAAIHTLLDKIAVKI
jgi:hypothetical protein